MLFYFVCIAGKTSAVPLEVLWGLLILLIIGIIIYLLYHYCWKKHGQYSFVPENANDGSDRSIAMTTNIDGVQV